MKNSLLMLGVVVLLACDAGKNKEQDQKMMAVQDESTVRSLIINLHSDLKRLYSGRTGEVDSVMATYYVNDMYYVTPWGTSETLDSTKARLKVSIPRISDYENSIENLSVKVYGDGAYAFYVLRQEYSIDGFKLDEYLPTTAILERVSGAWKIVHLQRSTDPQTLQQYISMQQTASTPKK
ncbi:MAG: nuclear transport factor 2 family protein [Bacteroidota bacterium]